MKRGAWRRPTKVTSSLKRAFRQQVMNLYFEGALKPSEKSVLMTLATFLGRGGLYPSHESLAEACRYSVRTVIRALERAYELGIVERTRRMKREGGKKVRTSNTYRLIVKASDQVRAAGKHMARALFRGINHLSDTMTDKVSPNIYSKGHKTFQPPQMTRDEMIREIMSW